MNNSNNNNNNQSEEKEIDLLYIFRSIKKGILNLFRSIEELLLFALKNIKTLSFFIIIGVGISIGLFFLKKPLYISSLTISHTRLNNGQCADLVNSLSKAPNDTILANLLGIDVNISKEIADITYSPINKNDSTFILSDFKIIAKVYNTNILDSLQKGITNFLESNEYATKRKQIQKLYLDKFEDRIKGEIIAIDSLKRIVDKSILPRSLGNGIILGESIDPVKVYQESMNLYKSQLDINGQRELNDSFEIIIGFSSPTPSSSLIVNILKGFIFSLFFGAVWLLLKRYNLSKRKIIE